MKLIHVQQARSVWLFDVSDLNPKGKDFADELVNWIKNRYSFSIIPDLKDVRQKVNAGGAGGLIFKQGRFPNSDGSFVEIASLAIHNDGLVVDTTSSTLEADRLLTDLLVAGAKEFGLAYDPEMIRKRLYVSVLIVKSDMAINAIHPGLASFAERISGSLANGAHFQLAGLQFWTEPNDNGVHKTFTFMPQAGKSLSDHRYYSEAPLQTVDHFALLEELERSLTAAS